MKTRIRASAICRHEDRLLVVRLRDPVTQVEAVYPPGGGIEPDETPSAAAAREMLEETGVRTRVDEASALVADYPFRWADVDYAVTTHFFTAELEGPFVETLPDVKDAAYNLGPSWMPVSDALEAMPPVIAAHVATLLRRQSHARWLRHPNIAGPAGTLLAIHDQFRAASRRLLELIDAGEPPRRLASAFAPLAQTLHHHHHAEEVLLFPALGAPERLADDHGTLTHAIAELEAALVAGDSGPARAFDRVLVTHLDREEEFAVPRLLAMSPSEAWAKLHG